jgi:fucose permease
LSIGSAILSRRSTQRCTLALQPISAAIICLGVAVVAGTVAVAIVILTAFGIEAKGVAFGTGRIRGPADPRTAASLDAI